jgi:hypothetical protein
MRQANATSRRRAWSPWPRRDDCGGGGVAKVVRPVARVGTGRVRLCVCERAMSWPPRVVARRRQGGTTTVVSGQGKGLGDGSGAHSHARVLAS